MRAVAVLSATVIAASAAVAVPGAVTEDSSWATDDPRVTCVDRHGEGTEKTLDPPTYNDDGVYEIETASQLVFLSENFDEPVDDASGQQWREKDFVQTADIDLQGCVFTPIGMRIGGSITGFEGSFNGNFRTISEFYTDHTTKPDLRTMGLFGVVDTNGDAPGSVENVVLVDATVAVSVDATVAVNAGLLVGENYGSVRDSSATGTVTVGVSESSNAGGLIGSNLGSVSRSRSVASVNSSGSAGGLVGSGMGAIADSYARGTVGGDNFVGGLTGLLGDDGSITNSFSAAVVTGQSQDTGGLVGNVSSRITIQDSFWDTTINASSLDSPVGTGKTTEELRTLATFTNTETDGLDAPWRIVDGWEPFNLDQNKVWGIRSDVNSGYPFLLWEYGLDRPVCPEPNSDGVYEIADELHLAAVGSGGEDGPCGDSDNYLQVADIDLANAGGWVPLGTESFQYFSGHYDGGGFTISNMSVTAPGTAVWLGRRSSSEGGLFMSLSEATIENLTIDNASITVAENLPETGGEFGQEEIRSSVFAAGILAGSADGSTIHNVHVSGDVRNLDTVAGGLIGYIYSTDEATEAVTEITACSVDVSMTTVDDAEIFLGGVVGALRGADSNVTISDCDVSADVTVFTPRENQFATVLEEFDVPGFFASAVGGVVGGGDDGSTLTLSNVTVSADSTIDVNVTEQGDFLNALAYLGGLVGFAAGSLEIIDSTIGEVTHADSPAIADQASITLDGPLSSGAIGGLVGIAGVVESTQVVITDSLASTRMSVTMPAGDEEVAIGGLLGWTFVSAMERSSAALTLDLTSRDGAIFTVGGVVGVTRGTLGEGTVLRHSSATGSITTTHTGTLGAMVAGGIAGEINGAVTVEDVWSAVDLSIDAGSVANPPNEFNPSDPSGGAVAGGAFGFVSPPGPGLIPEEDQENSLLEVRNVLSRGEVSLVAPTDTTTVFTNLRGSFAGLIDDENPDLLRVANSFALDNNALGLVGSGTPQGISSLTDAQLTTITPYTEAGWNIVPATAGNLPDGPVNEVWGITDTGLCAPYLWWQVEDIIGSCVTNPNTVVQGGGTSPRPSVNSEVDVLAPAFPGQLAPSPPEGADDTATENVDPTQENSDDETPAGPSEAADTETNNSSTDTGIASQPASTAWLWAIGLGGLGAALLIAGGVALTRVRR